MIRVQYGMILPVFSVRRNGKVSVDKNRTSQDCKGNQYDIGLNDTEYHRLYHRDQRHYTVN